MQEYKPSVARSSIFSREFDNVGFYVKCLILNVVDKVSFCFYHKRQLILFKINKACLLTEDSLWNLFTTLGWKNYCLPFSVLWMQGLPKVKQLMGGDRRISAVSHTTQSSSWAPKHSSGSAFPEKMWSPFGATSSQANPWNHEHVFSYCLPSYLPTGKTEEAQGPKSSHC